jgi:serine/threonine protein kinase
MNLYLSKYVVKELISEGAYGKVYNCDYILTNKPYAIKVCEIDCENGISPFVMREFSILLKCNHPNIIKIKEIFIHWINGKKMLCIVMDLCENTLHEYILSSEFKKNEHYVLLYQIIDALMYISTLGYMHGDLSITNILIKNKQSKLIDFGFSTKLYRQKEQVMPPTIYVRPYEFCSNNESVIKADKIDTWSFGCIYYFLTTKTVLFDSPTADKHSLNIFQNLKHCTSDTDLHRFDVLEEEGEKGGNNSIISKMHIIKDLHDKNLIEKMLKINPNKRNTVDEIFEIMKNMNNQYYQKLSSIYKKTQIDSLFYLCEKEKYPVSQSDFDINIETRIRIIDMILQINKQNNYSDETLFQTIYNFDRIKRFNKYNTIIIFIVYWLSVKLISLHSLKATDIKQIICAYDNVLQMTEYSISTYHDNICTTLKWDLDPTTYYDFIIYMEEEYHPYYIFLGKILLLHNKLNNLLEQSKAIIIYSIIKNSFNITDKIFDKKIINYLKKTYDVWKSILVDYNTIVSCFQNISKKNTDITTNYENNIYNYMNYYSSTTNNKNIFEWFLNIDYESSIASFHKVYYV